MNRLNVSISNITLKTYSGMFRIQVAISEDHTKLTGTVTNVQQPQTTWKVDMTKQ